MTKGRAMNVRKHLAALAMGCAGLFGLAQAASADAYYYDSDDYYAAPAPRWCYDAYGVRYYCGPATTYYAPGYYAPGYYGYYGPNVSIGLGYYGGYRWGHDRDDFRWRDRDDRRWERDDHHWRH